MNSQDFRVGRIPKTGSEEIHNSEIFFTIKMSEVGPEIMLQEVRIDNL